MKLIYNATDEEPISNFFELSYAQFLVLSRTVLQSMPIDWQKRFVQCLRELDEEIDWRPEWPYIYYVTMMNMQTHKYASLKQHDPFGSYDRGRNIVQLKSEEMEEKSLVIKSKNGSQFRCECDYSLFGKLKIPPLRYRCLRCGGLYRAEDGDTQENAQIPAKKSE
jgi:hypothetical protein